MSTYFLTHHIKGSKMLGIVLLLALLMWSVGAPAWMPVAQAASLTGVSDTLSDSDTSAPSNHTIEFTTPNGVMEGQTITITFPAGFGLGSIIEDDVDIQDDSTDLTTAGDCSGSDEAGIGVAGQVITIDICAGDGAEIASSSVITIKIGSHATESGTGANQITNPASPGTNVISIGGTMQDSADTRVYIIDDVVVTASVNTTFTFTIDGVATGATVNGSATTTADTTTATSLPFGTVEALTSKTLAQDLTVVTNARNGFVVTVQQDQNLQSATGADIDGFIDGAYTDDPPAAWVQPSATLGQENTYGHWGLTSEDSDLNGDEFGSDLWVAASTTPRQVFHHSSSTNGAVADSGTTRVGYQIEISALQEAGTDYTNTLTYIATPTF
ncbi:MAG: hypothetical protein WDZ88_02890 [Candidatus Paceibacterota bacterium]